MRTVMRIVAGLLTVAYGIGAPVMAYQEFHHHAVSERFGYPPALIFLTAAVQVVCALGVLSRRFAHWAAAALTITTLGAIGSHLKIESPVTALPAALFTVVQIWFGVQSYRMARKRPA